MRGFKTALTLAAGLVAVLNLGSCTEEEPETMGTVRIEISPLAGDLSMFNGTTEIVATLQYETCLQDFYLATNPDYQIDGPTGAAVFTEWESRLCDTGEFDKIPDCEITGITQTLLDVNSVYNFAVTYKINDASTVAYREINVGPIPLESFVSCGDNQRPRVELQQSGLSGRDANGNQLWRISSLPGSNVAVAGQGAPLRVEVIASNSP